MTEDEMAKAEAEYEALPGTPPDGWSFIPEADLVENRHLTIQTRLNKWKPGMTFVRFTDMTGEFQREGMEPGVWLEFWKVEPRKQATFNPPLVAKDTAA